MAAVLFNLLDDPKGTAYFSRMSLASHGAERDCGHTGNFWNILWAMPGVAQAGPQATGAWMSEFGAWYFDLARQWDGNFTHQGPPEPLLPQLRQMEKDLLAHREAKSLQAQIESLGKIITNIESGAETVELLSLD